MSANTDITHSFSRAHATQYGVHGAILLRYLINRIKSSTNIREGNRWFYDSIAALTENYPYLSQTAVNNARLALISANGPLKTGNFNKWQRDKTTWYSVRDDRTLQAPEDDLLYFKAAEAVAYGILEAVILNNLRYWLEEKQKQEPQYQYHRMSPRILEKVFQKVFSRNSIGRALEHLVKAGALIPLAPDHANGPIAYRVAGPEDPSPSPNLNEVAQPRTAAGGPSETEVAQNAGRGPSENPPAPTENLPGPTENEGGPSENEVAQPRTHLAQPRTTLPINNSLKEDCLKDCLEVCLKENRFKASSVGDFQNTLPNTASTDLPSSASTSNSFDETIASPLSTFPDSPSLSASTPIPLNESAASSTASASPPTPSSEPNVFVTAKLALQVSNPARISKEPFYTFLDLDGIHKTCWEVMQFHDQTKDPVFQSMAEGIVQVAERLINETDPAEIYRLNRICDQRTLNGELFIWSGKHFEDVFDQMCSVPDSADNADLRQLFREHSLCFLNMAFHLLRFDFAIYLGKPYAQIRQALWNRLGPWIEEQTANKHAKLLEERRARFASPDQDKEGDPNLSAPEKMQVLLQSLQSRNRIGKVDQFGQITEQVVEITQRTQILARTFFQLNPHFTVQDINRVLDACLKLPANHSEEQDPQWHARHGYKISLLLHNLLQVATQLNMLSQLPAFTPLPVEPET